MTKWFALALTVLIVAVAVPALADVTVTATIDKTKDKRVTETLTKTKVVTIDVTAGFLNETGDFRLALDGAAEVEAIVNVRNVGNTVDRHPDGEVDNFGIHRTATLTSSVNTNSGIVGVNQDVGNMVNQANVVSFGLTDSDFGFAESQAAVDQINARNTEFQRSATFDPNFIDRSATITGAITGNLGIVGVNQNAGNMNNQTNAVALALGDNAFVALAEADLGQSNSGNTVTEVATNKLDLIQDSISNNRGIVSVNQSSGNMNNQAAAVSIAAITSSVVLTPTLPVR